MKLGLRWSLSTFAVVALLVLVDVAALQWLIRREAEVAQAKWNANVAAQLQRRLEESGRTVGSALERIAGDPEFALWADEPVALRAWVDRASQWAEVADVDQLLLLDGEGRVLASALHPQSYGLRHPSAEFLVDLLPHAPVLYEEWEGSERPIHVGWTQRRGRSLLVLALRVDRARLARWGEELGLGDLRWRIDRGIATPSDFQLQRSWNLEPGGGAFPGAETLRSLARTVLAVQLALIALAIGVAFWLARRAARPIVELSRAVRSLRWGENDHLPVLPGGDELQRLSRDVAAMAEELSTAQQERLAAERRGAWREIAQRIAHEIKNVLSPLGLALDNLETTAGRQDEQARTIARRSLQTAREQLSSLDRLVGEFRSFARIPPPSLRDLDVPMLCRAAADALREAFPQAQIELADAPTLHGVRGDVELLRRALGNLLRNAAEAAPGQPIELAWGEGPGATHWWCAVRDGGPGLAPEILAHWGEPVQSAKSGGSGLGLSIVVQTLHAHGGRLIARNLDRGGCEMRWELPKRAQGFVIDGEEQAE